MVDAVWNDRWKTSGKGTNIRGTNVLDTWETSS